MKEEGLNLTTALAILVALINGLDLAVGNDLTEIDIKNVIHNGLWIDLVLFPFRVAGSWLHLALFVYFIWIFGSQLEEDMGMGLYASYLFCGCIFVLLGCFLPSTDGLLGLPVCIRSSRLSTP